MTGFVKLIDLTEMALALEIYRYSALFYQTIQLFVQVFAINEVKWKPFGAGQL